MVKIDHFNVDEHFMIKIDINETTEEYWDVYLASSSDGDYYFGKAYNQSEMKLIDWTPIKNIFNRTEEMIGLIKYQYSNVDIKSKEALIK